MTARDLSTNPIAEGRMFALLRHSDDASARPVMYGDERADALFAAAYCDQAAAVYAAWAARHKRHADAINAGGES